MKIKKIIKGMIGLGVMGGIAYAAYKLGECNGEVNERLHQKYDEDDDEIEFYDDDEQPDNYYGTCFETNKEQPMKYRYDEPDDGCLAPINQQIDNASRSHEGNVVDAAIRFPPLSSIHIKYFTAEEIESILLCLVRAHEFYKSDVKLMFDCGDIKANAICDAFLDAGYIFKKEKGRKFICNLTKKDYYRLLLAE